MHTGTHSLDAHSTLLHLKIRSAALGLTSQQPDASSVEEFCNRLNTLEAKSDGELEKLGIKRAEIGAHVIQGLLN